MAYAGRFGQSDDYRREELIRIIEHFASSDWSSPSRKEPTT